MSFCTEQTATVTLHLPLLLDLRDLQFLETAYQKQQEESLKHRKQKITCSCTASGTGMDRWGGDRLVVVITLRCANEDFNVIVALSFRCIHPSISVDTYSSS